MKDLYENIIAPEDHSLESLEEAFMSTLQLSVKWYAKKKRKKRLVSKFSHIVALISGAAGGTAPWWAPLLPGIGVELGYPLLGLSALAIVWDKVFGNMSSWGRHMVAMGELASLLSRYRLSRSKLIFENHAATERWALLEQFILEYWRIVLDETRVWSTGLSAQTQALESLPGRYSV